MKKILVTLALASTLSGCTPAQQADLPKVEPIVLADLAAGKSLEQMESDVAKVFAGQPGVDAVVLVNDALQLLVDEGIIPASDLPKAKTMLTQVAQLRAAVKK